MRVEGLNGAYLGVPSDTQVSDLVHWDVVIRERNELGLQTGQGWQEERGLFRLLRRLYWLVA